MTPTWMTPTSLAPKPRRNLAAHARAAAAGMAALAAAAGAAHAADGPEITSFTLENGMQAVVIEDHRAPVVTHMVWYRVGSADERPGVSGVAHYLEHLMFKGTETRASGEFSELVAQNGGVQNAFTSYDYTAYHQQIATDRLPLMMELEAERMTALAATFEEAEIERDIVIEERNQRTDSDPQGLFFEQLSAALYLNHAYGRPIIGWRHEIDTLDLDAAMAFYRRHYTPENAILIVAGDVEPEDVRALAEEHYGAIPARGLTPDPRPQEPPQLAPRRIELVDARVRQPFMIRLYQTPSYATAEPGEAEALSVMAEILGGGFTSRLSTALVLEQGLALNAGGSYRGVSRDGGTVSVYGVPQAGVALEDVEAAIDAEIARLAADGPTEEELVRARRVLVAASVFQQDSQQSLARSYGAGLAVGLTVEDVRDWPQRIRDVSAEDVQAAAAQLRIEASATGYLLSEEAAQ